MRTVQQLMEWYIKSIIQNIHIVTYIVLGSPYCDSISRSLWTNFPLRNGLGAILIFRLVCSNIINSNQTLTFRLE